MDEQNGSKVNDNVSKSYIYIEFDRPDSTLFSWTGNLVSPVQILAVASYLEILAKNNLVQGLNAQLQQQAMTQAKNKIVKPGDTGVVSGNEARALWDTLKE